MPKHQQIEVIERKLEEISQKVQQLNEIRRYLTTKLDRLKQETNASDFISESKSLATN
jgi:MerR family Zn(II)-responsive transcriptional regulator of zntA